MLSFLVKVEAVQPMRTFASSNGENVSALDLEVSKGNDRFVVTAFDKTALQLNEKLPIIGAYYWVVLSFSVRGTDKRFLSARLVELYEF